MLACRFLIEDGQETSQKKNSTKKFKKRTVKKVSLKIQLFRASAGLCVLFFLVIAAGFCVHYVLLRKQNVKPVDFTQKIPTLNPSLNMESPQKNSAEQTIQEKKSKSQKEIMTAKIPPSEKKRVYEILPEVESKTPKSEKASIEVASIPPTEIPKKEPVKIPPRKRPKVAIIIDDLGYDPYIAKKLVELEPRMTFSVIPNTPFQNKVVEIVSNKGGELMLHIPMEPNEYPEIDPGPGALLTTMEPDQLIAQLESHLDTLSDARGINGHMGSKLTANSEQMYQIFTVLKKRNMFFVDSLTTPYSVCKPSAMMLKVPFAQRDVFIDHSLEPEFMRNQVRRLIKSAIKNGEAIGIAHPHKETFEVLKQMMPEIRRQVDLVPASQLVK